MTSPATARLMRLLAREPRPRRGHFRRLRSARDLEVGRRYDVCYRGGSWCWWRVPVAIVRQVDYEWTIVDFVDDSGRERLSVRGDVPVFIREVE